MDSASQQHPPGSPPGADAVPASKGRKQQAPGRGFSLKRLGGVFAFLALFVALIIGTSQSARAVFLYENSILVADNSATPGIVRLDSAGTVLQVINNQPTVAEPNNRLTDVQVDPLSGNILVGVDIDGDNGDMGGVGVIVVFDAFGTFLREIPLPPDAVGPSFYPRGLDVLSDGSVLVAMPNTDMVVRVANSSINTILAQYTVGIDPVNNEDSTDVAIGRAPFAYVAFTNFNNAAQGQIQRLNLADGTLTSLVATTDSVRSIDYVFGATPAGDIIRVTYTDGTIEEYDSAGAPAGNGLFGVDPGSPSQDSTQRPSDGNIFVSRDTLNRVDQYGPGANFISSLTGVTSPFGVAIALAPASCLRYNFTPDFGVACVGDTVAHTLTITNTCAVPVSVDSVARTAGAPDFIVDPDPVQPVLLQPGSQIQFTVRFTPAGAPGARVGTLTVNSTDPVEPVRTFDLTGEVGAQDIQVTPLVSFFEDTCVGDISTETVTISNLGVCPLTVTSLAFAAGGQGFAVVSGVVTPLTLAPGASVDVDVIFLGAEPFGTHVDTLLVGSDDPDEPLSGASLIANVPPPDIAASPAALDFGNVCVGTPTIRNVQILNEGECELSVTTIATSGGNAGDFVPQNPTLPLIVQPGASFTLPVSVTATALGVRTTTLQVASTDPDENPLNITLTANATPADIATTPPDILAFGDVCVGDSKTLQLEIINEGGCTLDVTGTSLLIGGQGFNIDGPATLTLAAGESAPISITFTGATPFGAHTDILQINSNDPDTPTDFVVLTANVPPPDINVSPQALAFGNVCVGDVLTQSLEISNQGECPLTISSIALVAGSSPDFEVLAPQLPLILAAGATRTVQVRITPTGMAGPRTGTLRIISDDPDETQLDVPLTAEVLPADIAASPAALDFGNVCIGVRETRNVQILNEGGCDLTLNTFTIVGPNLGDFDVDPPTLPLILGPGQGVLVPVHVSATALGARSATLQVASNDPDAGESPLEIPLTATAQPGDINAAPQSVDFGDVCLGDSKTLNVTISNQGGCDLTLDSASLLAGSNGDFSVSSPQFPIILPRGDDITIQVTLTPTVANGVPPGGFGPRTGTLQVFSDDPDAGEDPLNIPLTGNVPPPDINAAPQSLAFGDVCLGDTKTLNLTISNQGGCDLTVNDPTFVAGSNGDFSVSSPQTPIVLEPGASTIIQVTFTPTVANGNPPFGFGPREGTLSITSNDPDGAENPLLVALTGNVPPPDINAAPQSLAFGDVCLGDTKTLNLTISNQGACDLTVNEPTLVAGSNGDFSFASPQTPVTLAPGASVIVQVTFTPTAANGPAPFGYGPRTGTLSITSNDPDAGENPLLIPLTGNVPPPDINVSPQSLDFGEVCVGDRKTLDLDVSNQGLCDLTVSAINISGVGFSVARPQLPFVLPKGGRITVRVTYTGTLPFNPPGVKSGSLTFVSDDPDANENPLVVQLTAVVPPPDIQVEPTELLFGDVCIGDRKELTLRVANQGECDLTITDIQNLDPAPAGSFTIQEPQLPLILKPSQSAQVIVVFSPNPTFGLKTGAVRFISNDPDENPLVVPLSGNAPPPDIAASPANINFQNVCVGVPVTRNLEIANTGKCDLTISNITRSSGSADFSVALPTLPFVVKSGGNLTVPITVVASSFGSRTATFSIASDDPDENPLNITVTANATPPDINITPATVNLGDVCLGDSASRDVVIRNQGGCDLTISSITVSGEGYSIVTPTTPLILAAGESATVQVTFTPSGAFGTKPGLLSINSNDPDTPLATVALTGNAPPPDITVSPTTVNLGNVCAGVPATQNVQILNSGPCDLFVQDIVRVSGTTDFSVSLPSLPLVLAPGGSVNVPITVNATVQGARNAEFRIFSNDPDESPTSVFVSATSVSPNIEVQGAPVDFGRVPLDDVAARTRQFQILNTGGCDLLVSSIAFSPSTTEFVIVDPAIDPTRPLVVRAGATLPVTVRFTPTSAGVKTATIVILSNDPDSPSVNVPVTGETEAGTIGSLSLPDGLAFPPTVIRNFGEFFSELPLTIGNNGSGTLRINNIAITGPGASQYRLTGLPAFPILLNSGDTVGQGDLRVQFRPTQISRHIEANVVITVADPISGQVLGTETVPLCGEGVAPGSRLLVTVGGAPSPTVRQITLQRQNKARFQNVITFRNVAPRSKNGNPPCPGFVFHVEVGGVDGPSRVPFLRPGTYRWSVVQRVGNRNVTKNVPFRIENGTFQDLTAAY